MSFLLSHRSSGTVHDGPPLFWLYQDEPFYDDLLECKCKSEGPNVVLYRNLRELQ